MVIFFIGKCKLSVEELFSLEKQSQEEPCSMLLVFPKWTERYVPYEEKIFRPS